MTSEEFDWRCRCLPRNLQIVLAAQCVERVLPIYAAEYHSDVGRLLGALSLAWRRAQEQPILSTDLAAAREAVGAATPNIEDESSECVAARLVCIAVMIVLDMLEDIMDGKAGHALSSTRKAAELSREPFNVHMGEHSEAAWQRRALQLLESWGERSLDPLMFDSLERDAPG